MMSGRAPSRLHSLLNSSSCIDAAADGADSGDGDAAADGAVLRDAALGVDAAPGVPARVAALVVDAERETKVGYLIWYN